MEQELVIEASGGAEVNGTPLNDKRSIGGHTLHVSEDAAWHRYGHGGRDVGALVVPERENRVGEQVVRQADVDVVAVVAGELEGAVGAYVSPGDRRSVEVERERQHDGGVAVVGVVADVIHAGYDCGAGGRIDHVVTAGA